MKQVAVLFARKESIYKTMPGVVGRASDGTKRPEVSKAEREHTPPELAHWLVELARRTSVRELEAA